MKKATATTFLGYREIFYQRVELALPWYAQQVFNYLCCQANRSGRCFLSRQDIATMCDMSVKTVDRAIDALTDRNVIEYRPGTYGSTNAYHVLSPYAWRAPGATPVQRA